MGSKIWMYAGLIIVVLAGMGVGIWLVTKPKADPVTVPNSSPVLTMDISNVQGAGEQSQLSIYPDGTVIQWTDTGVDSVTASGQTVTRTWRTGDITATDIDSLFSYLGSANFSGLDTYILPDSLLNAGENITITDRYLKISADYQGITNDVTVYGYFTSGSDPYANLPDPVAGIYQELNGIVTADTKQVLTENITK